MTKRETVYTLLFIFAAGFLWQLGCALAEVIVEWQVWGGGVIGG